jgi:hypothetical protein
MAPLFAQFISKMHHFTKTGSGQTQGKHSKKRADAFFAGAYGAAAANASQRIAWRGCTFTDISAGAVMLGDFKNWNCNGGSSSFQGADYNGRLL